MLVCNLKIGQFFVDRFGRHQVVLLKLDHNAYYKEHLVAYIEDDCPYTRIETKYISGTVKMPSHTPKVSAETWEMILNCVKQYRSAEEYKAVLQQCAVIPRSLIVTKLLEQL